MRNRFNPEVMADLEIYPEVIWRRDDGDALDYLVESFGPMVDFFNEAFRCPPVSNITSPELDGEDTENDSHSLERGIPP